MTNDGSFCYPMYVCTLYVRKTLECTFKNVVKRYVEKKNLMKLGNM